MRSFTSLPGFSQMHSTRWLTGVHACMLLGWLLAMPGATQAQTLFFEPASLAQARTAAADKPIIPKAVAYRINEKALLTYLADAPLETATNAVQLRLAIPLPNGATETFALRQTLTLSPALTAEYPDFKTYAGQGDTHPNYIIRMSLTSLGFDAVIWGVDGDAVYYKKTSPDPADHLYTTYFARDALRASSAKGFGTLLRCGSVGSTTQPNLPGLTPGKGGRLAAPAFSAGAAIRTFRIAIATTGEWTRNAGGFPTVTDVTQLRTNGLAVLTTTVNRLNGIFERDVSARFMLVNPSVSGVGNIIFDNPATDPYDNTDNAEGPNNQLAINQQTLDAKVGTASYDIGHLYGTGGGGVAATPSLCRSSSKAMGYSARGTDTGDPFVVDYVAHEIGHQFGMNHTYNTSDSAGACTTRSATTAYEVASGSTIMSYVGICNEGRNLQQYVDTALPSFHIVSLNEANTHLTTPAANFGAEGCGTSAGSNAIPTASAGAGYSIPRLTPFTLTATGADADAADVPNLLYSWEQFDLAPSASGFKGTPANTYDIDDDGILRPLLRPYSPVGSSQRTFPSPVFILNPQNNATPGENQPQLTYTGIHPTGVAGAVCPTGSTCVIGERLPTVARTMNFRVSVRDRRGGVADAGMSLTVVNTPGAFRLTAFDTASSVTGNTPQTLTWNVVNTDQAPINCANVRVLLSTDGGQTFSTTLVASTPNDGTEPVNLPNLATTQARIRIEAVGNVFFDINNVNFTITPASACTTFATVKAGNWGDPTTWVCGTVPPATAPVEINHAVTLPADYVAKATVVRYGTSGALQYEAGSRLQLGL